MKPQAQDLRREDGVLLQEYGAGGEVRGHWWDDDGGGRWLAFVTWWRYEGVWRPEETDALSQKALAELGSLLATPAAPQGQVDVLVGALERIRDAVKWVDVPMNEDGTETERICELCACDPHDATCLHAIAGRALAAYRTGVPQGERRGDAGTLPSSQIPQEQRQTCASPGCRNPAQPDDDVCFVHDEGDIYGRCTMSPTPWTTHEVGYERHVILDANGVEVAIVIRRRDAEAIVAAANASQPDTPQSGEEKP